MERLSKLESGRLARLRAHEPDPEGLAGEYSAYIREKREEAGRKLSDLERETAYEKVKLEEARREASCETVGGERRSTEETRRHVQKLTGLARQKKALEELDPDIFYMAREKELLQDTEDERCGRLIDVPYLKRTRAQIAASLGSGIPVYLVGHLGSGKTQLAMEAAEDFSREKRLTDALLAKLAAFREDVPSASRDQELAFFKDVYPDVLRAADEEKVQPLFIAGSHNLTAEEMFSEKTLSLETRENGAFGTVVKRIDKEVLKALKEGRPVIIDEINTIAMPNLIALNDILQHHAGQDVYVTGVGKVRIQDGFCLIGTGNLSTSSVSYEGTNVLNPAFQSRFTTLAYNYVPQNTKGKLQEQKNPQENELFHMIIVHLCSRDGQLALPEPEVSLDALFRLAQLARMSQNIFEGRSEETGEDGSVPVLHESVLSIRGLFHVLDLWNCGEEMDLTMALWNGFLTSVTNPDDRSLLLSLAARYGFFRNQDGWDVTARRPGEGALTYEDIRKTPYTHDTLPLVKLSREDVVHLLYGGGPARNDLPDELKSQIFMDEAAGSSVADFLETDRQIRDLEQSARVLENIGADEEERKA
jgi:MoxR-like ATPase